MIGAGRGRVLILDNRDSFVFNLADEFLAAGARVDTVRSDLSLASLEKRLASTKPHFVVLSPGPGRPEDAGVMVEWLRSDPWVPVLGICLGHQALAVAFGGEVGRAPRPVHGRKYPIEIRCGEPLLEGLELGFAAARYHSLVVTRPPESMEVVAVAFDSGEELVMGMRDRSRLRLGLQFHPESILTPHGPKILRRFLEAALRLGGEA